MRYEGKLYRPPSEVDAYILQATVGCSWNACVYCDMYPDKRFRVRPLDESLADLREAARRFGPRVRKLFIADGDALILPVPHWLSLVKEARQGFAGLFRSNHASNYLPLSGELPRDRERIVATIDAALAGEVALRPAWSRGP